MGSRPLLPPLGLAAFVLGLWLMLGLLPDSAPTMEWGDSSTRPHWAGTQPVVYPNPLASWEVGAAQSLRLQN